MKKVYISILCTIIGIAVNGQQAESIRLNQLGYYPFAPKVFIVANNKATRFEVINEKGESVFSDSLTARGKWDKSGESISQGDFTRFTGTGKFTIVLDNHTSSYPFEIKEHIYSQAANASLKMFYFQRMSMPIDEQYAGIYKRIAAHPDTLCYFHPSTGRSMGTKASPGGWYDAGDYNKYIINTAIAVNFLLQTHELYANIFADNTLHIPESGNGTSDLLDEIKYELDWALTMQDTDGGVFFKLSNLDFTPFVAPEKCTETRYFIGKSTSSALCFAGMMAKAYRAYLPVNQQYANTLLHTALEAWSWAKRNPAVAFKNPADVHTGEYGDNDFTGEFFMAAAELYISTNDRQYYLELEKNKRPLAFVLGDSWRYYVPNLGYYALACNGDKLTNNELKEIQNSIINLADSLLQVQKTNPYRITQDYFTWGSNSDISNGATILAYAYKITANTKYLDAIAQNADYIFGKNAIGNSFLTGFGSKSSTNPHHRLFASDGIDAPIPGYLVGGPNGDRNDENGKPWGIAYPYHEPARSYLDIQGSYASNEIAINWNAPLVFILSTLEKYYSNNVPK